MRRAIQLTLLAIFVSTVLVGVGIGYFATQRFTQEAIDRELSVVHDGVVRRFQMFDTLLLQEEEVMEARMQAALPQLADQLLADPSRLSDVSEDDLKALSNRLGVDNVYIIDRSTKIIATDFAPDVGFELGTISPGFRKFLQDLIGTGKVVTDRLTMSSKTGILTKYAYYSPKGSDYIAEVSLRMRDFLIRERSQELVDFLFRSFFLELVQNRENLTGLDIHMVNKISRFSLFDRNSNLPQDVADALFERDRIVRGVGSQLTVYSKVVLKDSRLATADFLAITTQFDFTNLATRIRYEVFFLVSVMLVASALTFYVAIRLASKHVVSRVLAVRGGLKKISNGRYDEALHVSGRDEIADIAADINVMRLRIRDDLATRERQAAEMAALAQEQAELREKAEVGEQAKSEFLSTVSHELRTPLTAIRGSLGLLQGHSRDGLPDDVLHLIDLANRNGERLSTLIDDILDLEKIQSGKMEFQMSRIEIGEFIEHAVATNQGYAERCKVRLEAVPGPQPLYVSGDEGRLQQVMANLLSNASKYSHQGAVVIVSWERHPVAVNGESAEGVRISVMDRGVGIPENCYAKVFLPFAQVDSSTTRAVGGTGLGLSISKIITDNHDGRLSFDSQVGEGSTFYLDLPLSAPGVDEAPAGEL